MNSVQSTPATKPYFPTATKVGENQFKINDPIPMELTGLKLTRIPREQLEQGRSLHDPMPDLPRLTPEIVLKDNLAKGDQRNISALIKMNNQVVGYMQTNGWATSRNSLKIEGDTNSERIDNLKTRYGSQVHIEEFSPGKGPTYAEAYEAFSGKNYQQEMQKQYQQTLQDVLQKEQSILQAKQAQAQAQQQRKDWESTPQTDLLTHNSLTISGWDNEGQISINHNSLLQLSEQAGYDLAKTRDIYRQIRDSESPEAAMAALKEHFTGDSELKALTEGEHLTRWDIMNSSPELIRDGYL